MSKPNKLAMVVLLTFGMQLLGGVLSPLKGQVARAEEHPPTVMTRQQQTTKRSRQPSVAARGPVAECVEAAEVETPCRGTLVPTHEALELLRIKNVELPKVRGDLTKALDDTIAENEACTEALNDAVALAEARGQLLTDVGGPVEEAGHSTWTVIGWTALGLGIGFLGGALVAKTAWR